MRLCKRGIRAHIPAPTARTTHSDTFSSLLELAVRARFGLRSCAGEGAGDELSSGQMHTLSFLAHREQVGGEDLLPA
jgi:hypothetical protein